MSRKRLLFIIGTRPELIKVFPIIHHLNKMGYEDYRLVSTGQHKDLLNKYWDLFNITPDFELDILTSGQDLSSLTVKAISEINKLLIDIREDFSPNLIIAQGDTTTVMAASMVAFYNGIKYAHIEAGLRSFDLQHPFPEEFNRKVSSIVSDYHFAPTEISKMNLLKESISESKVHVVGNTVIDTIHFFINSGQLKAHVFQQKDLAALEKGCVLITCHRRENHNSIKELISAIEILATENPNIIFVWPVHPNPMVLEPVKASSLKNQLNVRILEPLEYLDLLKVISMSAIILTDSGGIQEEAPSFRVPVLVLRDTTERPEAVNEGVSMLIGLKKERIIESFYSFKPEFGADFKNPYGDGKTSKRIIEILTK